MGKENTTELIVETRFKGKILTQWRGEITNEERLAQPNVPTLIDLMDSRLRAGCRMTKEWLTMKHRHDTDTKMLAQIEKHRPHKARKPKAKR